MDLNSFQKVIKAHPHRLKIVLIQLTGSGGTQLYTSRFFQAIKKLDRFDQTLILGDYLYNDNMFIEEKDKIHFFPARPSYFFMALTLFNPFKWIYLNRIISRENPDIVHIVFEDTLSTLVMLLLHLKKVKIVFTEHDPRFHEGEAFLVKINQSISKFILRRISDKIFVHGNALKDILVKSGVISEKIVVIPIGDFAYYTKWGDPKKTGIKKILFFGIISKYKGLEFLINAEPLISNEIKDYRIVIAGSGEFSSYQDLIKNPKKFEIHNRFIPDDEVASYFCNADVVVLPYTDASQSGVVPIAYAFKLPVIASNVGSIPEMVVDNVTGMIVPPRNIQALADAIITLLKDDTLRNEMGNNAFRMMKKELSWKRSAELTAEAYSSVVANKGRP